LFCCVHHGASYRYSALQGSKLSLGLRYLVGGIIWEADLRHGRDDVYIVRVMASPQRRKGIAWRNAAELCLCSHSIESAHNTPLSQKFVRTKEHHCSTCTVHLLWLALVSTMHFALGDNYNSVIRNIRWPWHLAQANFLWSQLTLGKVSGSYRHTPHAPVVMLALVESRLSNLSVLLRLCSVFCCLLLVCELCDAYLYYGTPK
jgi:hypothetical protein